MSSPQAKSPFMKAMTGRTRTMSECSEDGKDMKDAKQEVKVGSSSTGYELDGKFTYSSVGSAQWRGMEKTALDVDGKFKYFSADMRPVPPGWYDVDKSKHMVPIGWYDQKI